MYRKAQKRTSLWPISLPVYGPGVRGFAAAQCNRAVVPTNWADRTPLRDELGIPPTTTVDVGVRRFTD